jgi:hypothetical protein
MGSTTPTYALQTFAGSFNITTGTSDVSVTGVGFQPKVIIFWWVGRTESVDTVGGATHLRGFGLSDGTNHRGVTSRSENGAGTSVADRGQRTDACIIEMDASGTVVGYADVKTLGADGFTMEILDQFVTNIRVSYMAIAGSDLTNYLVGDFQAQAGTGNQAVSSVGFQPDAMMWISVNINTNGTATSADSQMGIGWATGTSNEYAWTGGANDVATTSEADSYVYNAENYSVMFPSATPGVSRRSELVSFDANGFTVNWLEAANHYVYFLALKTGGAVKVLTTTTATNTTPFTLTGAGFQPVGAMFISHNKALNTQDTLTGEDKLSVGAAHSTSARTAQAMLDVDAQPTTIVRLAIEFDAVYINQDSSGLTGLMDVNSFDSDGLTLQMDDADPSAASVGVVVFGPTPAGGGSPVRGVIGGGVF